MVNCFVDFNKITDDDVIINEESDGYLKLPVNNPYNEHLMRKCQADVSYLQEAQDYCVFVVLNTSIKAVVHRGELNSISGIRNSGK